jgi:hypothetical protein
MMRTHIKCTECGRDVSVDKAKESAAHADVYCEECAVGVEVRLFSFDDWGYSYDLITQILDNVDAEEVKGALANWCVNFAYEGHARDEKHALAMFIKTTLAGLDWAYKLTMEEIEANPEQYLDSKNL